ncbi:MAG: alkaline phosphatase family protein [Candidatus Kapaibacterium sp.]
MSKFITVFLLLLCVCEIQLSAQDKPKLVVVISYDQLRGDRLEYYKNELSPNGFLRVMQNGVNYTECLYNHANNMTSPGHAIIATGTYPKTNGIVTNEFIDRKRDSLISSVYDSVALVSPRNLYAPTLGEVLKQASPQSKVFSLAIKDRAAVLMGGAKANGAYWLDTKMGGFGTSKFYKLPAWVLDFNNKHIPMQSAGKLWQAIVEKKKMPSPEEINAMLQNLKPGQPPPRPAGGPMTELERETMMDNMQFEGDFPEGGKEFPHRIPEYTSKVFWHGFVKSPFAIDWSFEFAKVCIEKEHLGEDTNPDLLCIGVSTTDDVGHTFGPDSREMKEIVLSADKILATFIEYLDKRLGRDNYIVAITGDHGVTSIPEVAQSHGKDAGRITEKSIVDAVEDYYMRSVVALTADVIGGENEHKNVVVRHIEPPSLFIDTVFLKNTGQNISIAKDTMCAILKRTKGIGIAIRTDDVIAGKCPPDVSKETFELIRNDVFLPRTGDILFYPRENWIIGSKPTTHGTPYRYDRWVPLIFFGNGLIGKIISEPASPDQLFYTLAKELKLTIKNPQNKPLDIR